MRFDKFRLTDRVAVVVGGGSGIARACAIAFAEVGANVAVLDVDRVGGEKTLRFPKCEVLGRDIDVHLLRLFRPRVDSCRLL